MLDSANTLQNELCKSSQSTTTSATPPATNESQEPGDHSPTSSQKSSTLKNSDSKKLKSQQPVNTKFWSQSLANILQTNTELDG